VPLASVPAVLMFCDSSEAAASRGREAAAEQKQAKCVNAYADW
jgi:hypothetical protein